MLNKNIFQCQGNAPYGNEITKAKDKYCEQLLMQELANFAISPTENNLFIVVI
jgi:hypothetical protein